MNKTFLLFISAILIATTAWGQVKEDFQPSELNQPGQQYPMVNPQGFARFRIKAPEASSVKVTLRLGGSSGTMPTKDADGVWTDTTAIKNFIIII